MATVVQYVNEGCDPLGNDPGSKLTDRTWVKF